MPVVNGKHFSYTAKGRAAAKRESETSTVKVPKFKRRQRIRENARGKSASQLKPKGNDFRAKVLARLLQNRSLKRENPNWRKEAGGSKGMFKQLRQAKARPTEGPWAERSAAELAKVQARVKEFKTNRREMLSGSKQMTGGEAPKRSNDPMYVRPGIGGGGKRSKKSMQFAGKKRKRGGYIGS